MYTKYYPMAMHLHCGHQPGGSVESHIYNAAQLGMKYMWITPHDTRTGPDKYQVRSFDFSRGEATYTDESGTARGWKPMEASGLPGGWITENDLDKADADVCFDGKSMILEVEGKQSAGGMKFYSEEKRQTVSLLAEVVLTLDLSIELQGAATVILDVEMSQRPPDHKQAHIQYYVCGEPAENNERGFAADVVSHVLKLPLSPDADGYYRLKLTEDMRRYGQEIGGLDNAFNFLHVWVLAKDGGKARCQVSSLEITTTYGFDEVIQRQRVIADEIGAHYGVKPFVTTEISGAGQHKNCYSTAVPVIDYAAGGYSVTGEDAVAHVKQYGGVFCYNHPLLNGKWQEAEYTPEQLDKFVEEEAALLASEKMYGASLTEIGFPEGRGKFSRDHYLRFWDLLSLKGVFITGCGDSDSHYSSEGWFSDNNFATWIAGEDDESTPDGDAEAFIQEEVFAESMKAGRAYCGDPVFLKDPVEFTSEGLPMGAILAVPQGDEAPRMMDFKACNIPAGWKIWIVVDGVRTHRYTMEETGDFACSFAVFPVRPVSFARVEIYREDGRCILLTNPIYLVKTAEFAGEIPECRCYGRDCATPTFGENEFAVEKTFNEKLTEMSEKYGEIELPKGIEEIKGLKILHIGDTETVHYPYFFRLIEQVKPDVILHTGDSADEVKVGRVPGTEAEYLQKIKWIYEAMKQSGARLIFTSGNNDLPEEIRKMVPGIEIYPANSVLELDGVECRIGHRVIDMTFDKDWTFYGHGLTGESWSMERNHAGKPCRFNTTWGAFVYCLSEKKYFHLKRPF